MITKKILMFLFIFSIGLITAIPTCSDTNQQDISKIPCVGFTVPLNCSGNITAFNSSNPEINYSIQTILFTDNIYNFTLNLSQGEYQLIDCGNNTALWEVKLVEQGYGTILFTLMFPAIILSFLSLFISGRMFLKFTKIDEKQKEELIENNNEDSFVPKSRLIPIVIMLFSFVPIIFMIGFVSMNLEQYLATYKITEFFSQFYVLFLYLFYFVFLISFLVWLSSFIKMRRVMRDLDEIE